MDAINQDAGGKDRWPLIYGATVAEAKSIREWGIKGDCWLEGMERDYIEWVDFLEEQRIEQCVLRVLEKWSGKKHGADFGSVKKMELKEMALFKLANECLALDKSIRTPPPHSAVLRAALIDRMNPYDMERKNKWPRKTAELRLKNIETNLLNGAKISHLHVDTSVFKNVDAQIDAARQKGRKVHSPALLDNTHGSNGAGNRE